MHGIKVVLSYEIWCRLMARKLYKRAITCENLLSKFHTMEPTRLFFRHPCEHVGSVNAL